MHFKLSYLNEEEEDAKIAVGDAVKMVPLKKSIVLASIEVQPSLVK